jgi:hypothetical protein
MHWSKETLGQQRVSHLTAWARRSGQAVWGSEYCLELDISFAECMRVAKDTLSARDMSASAPALPAPRRPARAPGPDAGARAARSSYKRLVLDQMR